MSDPDVDRCWTHRNAGPGVLVGDTRPAQTNGLTHLERKARSHGWVREARDGWGGPDCRRRRQEART